jgi:hypothetical protein
MKGAPFYLTQNHGASGAISDGCAPFYERKTGPCVLGNGAKTDELKCRAILWKKQIC